MAIGSETKDLIADVKRLVNEHFLSDEVQVYLNTRFTPARARRWSIHVSYFVRNRRDCWALAMGQAPLEVKREIWLHEQDELIGDPRAEGIDHFTLNLREAELFGVTEKDIESAELHPFVVAALDAWILLARSTWLESFASVAVVEMVNSNALVTAGGFSYRIRQKLMTELGIRRELLRDKNIHVQADQEHPMIFDKVISQYTMNEPEREIVWEAVNKALVIDRAYRGGLAYAMNQIPA